MSTFISVFLSTNFTIGTDALSSTLMLFSTAISFSKNSCSKVLKGKFVHLPENFQYVRLFEMWEYYFVDWNHIRHVLITYDHEIYIAGWQIKTCTVRSENFNLGLAPLRNYNFFYTSHNFCSNLVFRFSGTHIMIEMFDFLM